MSRLGWLAVAAILALLIFRIALVATWHQTGGDGVQYYKLATQLRADNTFAFEPNSPSYARLPGYPLFLAYFAAPGHMISREQHVRAATIANVLLDFLSALLLWGSSRRLGLRRPWAAGLTFLLLPTLWLMSCYAMTETLSTALVATELYLAVRLLDEPRLGLALAAGAIAGFAQLVRLDALCAVPMVAYACLQAPAPTRQRVALVATFALAAAVVFAPWPIRNEARFGAPHFAASSTRTRSGRPFGDGLYNWARTWADSGGDAFFELYFVYQMPFQIDRPGALSTKSYDDAQERAQIVAVLKDYNAHGLSDRIDQEFLALARARFRKHPVRTLLVLPLKRLLHMFAGEPEYDMPMVVRWAGLPLWRPAFGVIDLVLTVLALAGVVIAFRTRSRLFWLLMPALVLRLGIYAFAVPHATTHRFLVEAFPLLILLAAITIDPGSGPVKHIAQDRGA